jgi:hypothetical protein
METRKYLQAVAAVLQKTDATERRLLRRQKLAGGVPFRFLGHPVAGPQCVTITLQVRGEDLKVVENLGDRLAYSAGSQFCRVYRDLGVIRCEFTLPRAEWQEVHLADLPHRASSATIGQKALGPVARVDWAAPHKALFGSTRSGKTTCLADIIISLARTHHHQEVRFLILNPKNDPALRRFERLAHLEAGLANGYEDAALLLRYALAEMDRRLEDYSRIAVRWVIFVDEISQLAEVQPEVGPAIVSLSQMAGGLNMNLVMASQAANPKVFGKKGSLAKANLPSRIVFQLPREQAYLGAGLEGQRTDMLGGNGDGLAVNNGRVTRFRAALPLEADYERLPRLEAAPAMPAGHQVAGDATWQIDPQRLAYALMVRDSATAIQKEFGGATGSAMLVRDYAVHLKRWMRHYKNYQGGAG